MWCYRLRAWQSSPLFVIISFLVAAGLVVQLKTVYDNHQRHNRIMDYEKSVADLADTLDHVDKVTARITGMQKRIEAYAEGRGKRVR